MRAEVRQPEVRESDDVDRAPAAMRATEPGPRPLQRAFEFAARRAWAGWDPYDGLLSPLARLPILSRSRLFRIAGTQIVKRSPWNPRPLLGIPPTTNPKALALFLSAAARAPAGAGLGRFVVPLAQAFQGTRKGGCFWAGWGYPFPWQGRSFFLPAGTPTVVVTAFVGEAFLDAHEATGEERFLATALDACRFVLEGLNRFEDSTGACLSYSPLDRTRVFNASLLGARLLTLAGERAARPELLRAAAPLVAYALARQRPDGSWAYGEARNQGWTDSFHTGFVLGALDVYERATRDPRTREAVERGLRFYASRLFGPRGEPYYEPDRRHPYDIHAAAQGVLTFLGLRDRLPDGIGRAAAVGRWMVRTMLDPEGFFYYQVRRTHTVRIPYMRWSQAWGVRALAELARAGVEA